MRAPGSLLALCLVLVACEDWSDLEARAVACQDGGRCLGGVGGGGFDGGGGAGGGAGGGGGGGIGGGGGGGIGGGGGGGIGGGGGGGIGGGGGTGLDGGPTWKGLTLQTWYWEGALTSEPRLVAAVGDRLAVVSPGGVVGYYGAQGQSAVQSVQPGVAALTSRGTALAVASVITAGDAGLGHLAWLDGSSRADGVLRWVSPRGALGLYRSTADGGTRVATFGDGSGGQLGAELQDVAPPALLAAVSTVYPCVGQALQVVQFANSDGLVLVDASACTVGDGGTASGLVLLPVFANDTVGPFQGTGVRLAPGGEVAGVEVDGGVALAWTGEDGGSGVGRWTASGGLASRSVGLPLTGLSVLTADGLRVVVVGKVPSGTTLPTGPTTTDDAVVALVYGADFELLARGYLQVPAVTLWPRAAAVVDAGVGPVVAVAFECGAGSTPCPDPGTAARTLVVGRLDIPGLP